MIGLFGGAFDPPHRGHVELARRAKEELGLGTLLVLVEANPGHKRVETPADVRLRLTRAAFPDDDVLLDEHARTVDTLRALESALLDFPGCAVVSHDRWFLDRIATHIKYRKLGA